jgi:hypothetical protein
MAEVTREEFDQLEARVSALESPEAVRTEPETPDAPEAGAPDTSTELAPEQPVSKGVLTLSPPKVIVDGVKYKIEGSVAANEAATLTYLQIAVRGDGANDLGHKPGTAVKPGDVVTVEGSSLRAKAGDFVAWVAYSLNGHDWFDGPKTAFTITKEAAEADLKARAEQAGKRRIPLVGHSGLGFNSIVFRQDPGGAEQFGKSRGVAVDGLLWFTTRQSWGDYKAFWAGKKAYLETGKLVVTTLPHAPESEGDSMNSKGANDAYRNQQRDFGKWLAANGLNVPNHVLRVDWECNGNWYRWSANRPGGPGALKLAIANFVKNVRAGGATEVKFDLCWNKGPSQSGADYSIFPGAEYIDVVAIDQYDMWGPSFNDAQWSAEIRKTPALANLAAFATEHGIMWAVDEGGNTHGGGAMGGDNPFYWQKMRDFIDANVNNCAWHTTYDHPGAPATLRHDFGTNPKSWARYKQLFRPA